MTKTEVEVFVCTSRTVLRATKKYAGLPSVEFRESVWCDVKLNRNDNLLVGGIYRSPNSSSLNNDSLNSFFSRLSMPSHTLICGDLHYPEINWNVKLNRNDNLLDGGIYRSPNSSVNNDSLNSFFSRLSMPSHTLICGDLHYPEINWNNFTSNKSDEHKSSKFLDAIQDSFLFQQVDKPTHFRANEEPTLIDLILTNEEAMFPHTDYLPPLGLSHHSGLRFDYTCYSEIQFNQSEQIEVYKFHAGNYDGMRIFVSDLNLLNNISNVSAEEAWSSIDKALTTARENFVPKKKIIGVH